MSRSSGSKIGPRKYGRRSTALSVPSVKVKRTTKPSSGSTRAMRTIGTSSVERRGILSLGTELGGWGRVSVEGVRIAERGLRNILRHFAVLAGDPETGRRDGGAATRHMMVRDQSHFTFAPANALFEPRHRAGEAVEAGALAGFLHFVEDVDRAPVELRYRRSGVLWMAAGPGRVQRGDAIAVVMTEYAEP